MFFMTFGWQTQAPQQQWERAVVMTMSQNSFEQNREFRRFLRKMAENAKFSQRA